MHHRESHLEEIDLESFISTNISCNGEFLDLSGLGLNEIPEEIQKYKENISWLDLSGNNINSIPDWFYTFDELIFINLSSNKIYDLPIRFFMMRSLLRLDLDYNNLSNFKYWSVPNSTLEILNLGYNQLRSVPENIRELTGLRKLILKGNRLSSIPQWLNELRNLQSIDLSKNNLSTFPKFTELVKLEGIDLSSNRITKIPSQVGAFIDLKKLGLSKNNLNSLPDEIIMLQKLTKISLSNNNFIQIPDQLKELKKLEEIDIGSNKLEIIPPWFKSLENLKFIDLRRNLLTDVPKWLFEFRKVEYIFTGHKTVRNENVLSLTGNPLLIPPFEIIERGNEAVLQYFQELEKARKTGSTIRLAEAKCLILGEGGAGKTSLTIKLLNRNAPLPEEKDTTKGINVHLHDLTLADGSVFRLNIWDFGGQEIYHATHQFFLTKRSLYLLLDDTRKDEKTVNDPIFNYWLQIAELYGGGSPLLIVQNEKGDRSKELDLRGMQGRFGFVKDAKAVNLLTCRGLDKVQEAIEFWIKQLPHIGEEQPKAWLDVRRELERLVAEDKRDHISLEEYYRICAQHTVPERERALFLSSYLHDFGAFLHFQDHPLLRKILVLNNQWATDAVYKVLDSEEVKRAFGRFTRGDLAKIWADDCYADQHEDLLALMEKFELCYKLPDEKTETWLAPQLLSVLQPESLIWKEEDNLQIRYEYDFMPKGLLSQHIVRMHRYVRQPDLAWKSGVVFERAGSQALVIEAWGSRKISLRARGAQAKELLTLLSEDFDKIHERLAGLKVKKMIPCNCHVCEKSKEPHFYEYEDLTTRKEKGKLTIECKVSYEDVGVIKLLDGIIAKKTLEPRRLLEFGQIEEALRQLPTSDDVSLLLSQFTDAEREFQYGRITHKEFERVKNRVLAAAMKLI